MGTVYTEYEPNTWEWAVSRIIVQHELEWPTGNKTPYRDLYRSHLLPAIARTAWTELGQSGVDMDAHELIRFLAKKQHDYGHYNILEHGQHGVMVRLWDKIARYDNLQRRGVDPENESLQDTLQDMIGYCIIYMMLGNNTFTLPLAEDAR